MKIVTSAEMVRLEKLAYSAGFSEEEFMEKAGLGVASRVRQMVAEYHLQPKILFLCGRGNNGGDGFVAARHLIKGGFDIEVLVLASGEENLTPLAQIQCQRFIALGGKIRWIQNESDLGTFSAGLIVDALLGTGFHGEVAGLFKTTLAHAQNSKIPILSIDIPSGLGVDATETLFLALPKLECFLEGYNRVGKIRTFNFGVPPEILEQAESSFFLLEKEAMAAALPPLQRDRHKYSAGYVVGIGGSPGMAGAPLMASLAALRTGAGIVRLCHTEDLQGEFPSAPLELIYQSYKAEEVASLLPTLVKASALFIGPGLGIGAESLKVLQCLLPQINTPCVLDAQALTLIAEHKLPVPRGALLTPHRGEMKRLLQLEEIGAFPLFLEKCRSYAEEKGVTLVLKGAPTFIFHPSSPTAVCSLGDPGMATAGTGDILTGMITSLLAQGKRPQEAAYLGVYLHAKAGELAAQELTSYCMIATDLLRFLPTAFKSLQGV